MDTMNAIQTILLRMNKDGFNVLRFLAKQKKDALVDQILTYGGSVEDAIYGYACSGNLSKVQELIESNKSLDVKQVHKIANAGFIRGNHSECIEKLGNSNSGFVLGYAQSGNKEKVTTGINNDFKTFTDAVIGYATCNHGKLLKPLLIGTRLYYEAIYNAAQAGHQELVEELFQICGLSSGYKIRFNEEPKNQMERIHRSTALGCFNLAAQGYLSGFHFKEAEAMLLRGASFTQSAVKLVGTDELPDTELYLAFYAHAKSKEIQDAILKHLQLNAQVDPKLKCDPEKIQLMDAIRHIMTEHNMTYFEAYNELSPDAFKKETKQFDVLCQLNDEFKSYFVVDNLKIEDQSESKTSFNF